ncbi:MAG: ABC transporter ATP-binding protein [Acidimicrobiia bacterium]
MIEVEDLRLALGGTQVIDGLSFRAPEGEVTGFLGPNGAGKTTTMRILATLLRPDSGSARVAGHDVVREPTEVRRRIGLVTEEPSLLDRLTVREQLTFTGRAYDLSPQRVAERIEVVASLLELDLDKRAGTLSKGNRQKASLARALVHDPPVLLLDEPTANLDVVAQAAMQELLRRPEVRSGKTVFLSTHVLDEAERLCDRVVGIVSGKVVAEGTPAEIVARSGAPDFRSAFLDLLGTRALG